MTILRKYAALIAGIGLVGGGYVFAGHQSNVSSYTGCLNLNSGTFTSVKVGDTPLMACGQGQVQVHLSGGDITAVNAGPGLTGGAQNGSATLSLSGSYVVPQDCATGSVPKWNGNMWTCGSDADTSAAFGGFAAVGETFSVNQDVPDAFGTIGSITLPAGKYAVFAKVTVLTAAAEDVSDVTCHLIAESDFDEGFLRDEDGEFMRGVIALQLVHEFLSDGAVSVQCTDHRSENNGVTYNNGGWSNLRITAIRVNTLQNSPL